MNSPDSMLNIQSPYELPRHYKMLYASFLRLACTMILFAFLMGILHRESTRHLGYSKLAPGFHWESVYHLALLHGHIFMIGVILPLTTLVMLQFALFLGAEPLSEASTIWGKRLYHWGAGLTLLLFLYKGYHYVLSVRSGILDFSHIEAAYFGGQTLLKACFYGISHTSMGFGLSLFAVGILKTVPTKKAMIG